MQQVLPLYAVRDSPPARETGGIAIEWDGVTEAAWAELLARVPRSSLEQSWPYGEASLRARLLVPRRGVIRMGGEPVGLVQLGEIDTLGLGCAVLERGPLWISANVPVIWWREFIDLFASAHTPRLGRLRRFRPELPDSDVNRRMIETAGFIPLKEESRRSIWVDLKLGDVERWRALRADWRAQLRTSEKARLKLQVDRKGAWLGWLLNGGRGRFSVRSVISERFTRALARSHFASGTGLLYVALEGGAPVAAALFLIHGKCATYGQGRVTKEGRIVGALHLLMWRAMQDLQAQGIAWLDAGWFTAKTREDVIAFKRGMGGEVYELLPMFR